MESSGGRKRKKKVSGLIYPIWFCTGCAGSAHSLACAAGLDEAGSHASPTRKRGNPSRITERAPMQARRASEGIHLGSRSGLPCKPDAQARESEFFSAGLTCYWPGVYIMIEMRKVRDYAARTRVLRRPSDTEENDGSVHGVNSRADCRGKTSARRANLG